jgi:biofilm PGA synthesis N-glycosyltransferase PgaC
MSRRSLTYGIITPARNEGENLRILAGCLRAQTRRLTQWVVVDNGSTDATGDVVRALARVDSRISMVSLPGTTSPTRGGPVVRAFHAGLEAIEDSIDVVVKLDADLTFEPDYFDRLVGAFERDPALGIASGTGFEPEDGTWRQKHVTRDHVWGCARAYRWACLQGVLPLQERQGWDQIDETTARLAGWRTRTLVDLPFYHHRLEGKRDGRRVSHWGSLGRSAHFNGYRPTYLIVRTLHRARQEPAALAMISGYLAAALRREPQCDWRVRGAIREEQRLRRLPRRILEARGRPSPGSWASDGELPKPEPGEDGRPAQE